MNPAFVLDASVALLWFFSDEKDFYADKVAASFGEGLAVVPTLFWIEVTNGLLLAEKRGRASFGLIDDWIRLLEAMPIETQAAGNISVILQIGRNWNLTAYDATYMELGRRLSLPVASLDDKLCEACMEGMVGVWEKWAKNSGQGIG